MEIALLASGSKGNATLVREGGACFLVDAGISARRIEKHLAELDVLPQELLGIVLTHEHSDHIRSVRTMARRWDIPVWTNRATRAAGAHLLADIPRFHEVEVGVPLRIGPVKLVPFSTPHDAADPFGLILEAEDGYRIGLATDIGFATRLLHEKLMGVNGVVLEFNHDLDMLQDGPYPWHVKQRIRGKLGHLNNEDAGLLLEEIATSDLEWVVCAHISEENNAGGFIRERAMGALLQRAEAHKNGPAALHLASQHAPSPLFGAGTALREDAR
ncbi:MAG: MBL fold metallo-hydrolase [bacterium]|nr:MBL fold metallo-hydrolase [bacterium]